MQYIQTKARQEPWCGHGQGWRRSPTKREGEGSAAQRARETVDADEESTGLRPWQRGNPSGSGDCSSEGLERSIQPGQGAVRVNNKNTTPPIHHTARDVARGRLTRVSRRHSQASQACSTEQALGGGGRDEQRGGPRLSGLQAWVPARSGQPSALSRLATGRTRTMPKAITLETRPPWDKPISTGGANISAASDDANDRTWSTTSS